MKKEVRDYLHAELVFFQKETETQFTHFMGVFYFWTVVVAAPVTAGLLKFENNQDPKTLKTLLLIVALLGMFLAAKMFDIRCAQLKYTSFINRARGMLHTPITNDLPKSYKLPFPSDANLRKTALTDFGIWMAVIMSGVDAVCFGFALPLLISGTDFNCCGFIIFWIIGVAIYLLMVYRKVPDSTSNQ
jgi:hypothetical protein